MVSREASCLQTGSKVLSPSHRMLKYFGLIFSLSQGLTIHLD